MTDEEIREQIRQNELAGRFDTHIDPIPEDMILPTDEYYRYTDSRRFFEKIKYAAEKIFLVIPFTFYQNLFCLRTRVVGRENLRGLRGAVITSNHVEKFDCLAQKFALLPRRTYVVGGSFNNMKGFWGEMMRAGDMLPLNTTIRGTVNFNRAVNGVLTKKRKFLLVYPEGSMWRDYKKPRPFKDGAFYIAEKNGVPVVPTFISFEERKNRSPRFVITIGKPIYPDGNLDRRAATRDLQNHAFKQTVQMYEAAYGTPLSYTCDEKREEGQA